MDRVSGEKAPAFTSEELERLVDGVLAQYTLLYGPPDKQKKGIWRAIVKEVQTLGVFDRRSTHCRKQWEDLHCWERRMAEAQLELASQRGRGARRTLTPLMFRILAVTYPELDGCLKASQQPQGVVRGSKEAPVSPASVPPTPAKTKKVPPPGKSKKWTAYSKEKEAQPATKVKSKTPAGRSKEAPPSAKGRKGLRTPAKALQPSEAAGEGLEGTTTTASTATCTVAGSATCTAASTATCTTASTVTCTAASSTTASSSSPCGQPSKAAREGLVPPPTTDSTDTCTVASTVTCTARCTAASSSSSPSGQPSEATGEGLEPSPTTGSTDTSTGTATTVQLSPPVDGL
ncbi:hypothetical protein NDU88_001873 [Pleurodeles waltl]|uniref:Myb/SANT-like DNA-binding domain-containing protein n=1 Tax=Pleurodeles waltl TaxID=8319 RepID=A0AAV7TJ10_PLEWA|nr:hypothetical protein NDU88_001873 [Pleurodeles waltl]